MRSSLVLGLVLVLASGCFGPRASPVEVHAYLPLNDAEPGRGTEFAFFLRSTSQFQQTLPVASADVPTNWTVKPESATVLVPGQGTTSLIVRVTPDANASFGPHTLGVLVGDTRADIIVNVKELGSVPLRAGIGTTLTYVLWYDNGTLLESDEKTVRDQPGLAWVPSNDTPDFSPLNVYVGGTRGVAPPEPYNSTGCTADEKPPCYHPVIAGFDARLRDAGDGQGMVAGETLAVRIPREQAYGYAGNDAHPLFHDNLNFLIRIVSVDEYNVKSCTLPVCS